MIRYLVRDDIETIKSGVYAGNNEYLLDVITGKSPQYKDLSEEEIAIEYVSRYNQNQDSQNEPIYLEEIMSSTDMIIEIADHRVEQADLQELMDLFKTYQLDNLESYTYQEIKDIYDDLKP